MAQSANRKVGARAAIEHRRAVINQKKGEAMKVLITGATGFVGKNLSLELLRRGHDIHILTRSAECHWPYPGRIFTWKVGRDIGFEAFEGVEAVIHLAGASIIGRRWSISYKKELWDSRALGTQHLVEQIQKFGPHVSCFVSASATGYYGHADDQVLTEESPVGSDFLAKLCQSWEEKGGSLSGVRTVIPRIGLVLGRGGGLLDRLHSLFRYGLGSPLGSGRQWMSWIHLDDLICFMCEALETPSFRGVYNLTAPEPVRNKGFMVEMAQRLRGFVSPAVPYVSLRFMEGEVARYLVASQRVYPQRLLDCGFSFKYRSLSEAMNSLLPDNPYDNEFNSYQWLKLSKKEVFSFFSNEQNLEKITPPWVSLKVLKKSTPKLEVGTLLDYKIKIRGFPIRWRTKITRWDPPNSFSDVQIKGPYKKWDHTHQFERLSGGTLMTDQVCFRVPMGYLGNLCMGGFIKRDVERIFSYRSRMISLTSGYS